MVNTKKYKHVEDIIEDYLQLQSEKTEIPLQQEKIQDKINKLNENRNGSDKFPADEAQDYYKIFAQQQKLEEQQQELNEEFTEVENILKSFLSFIKGKIEYERKEDHDKNKVTYLFWIEDNQIRSNR